MSTDADDIDRLAELRREHEVLFLSRDQLLMDSLFMLLKEVRLDQIEACARVADRMENFRRDIDADADQSAALIAAAIRKLGVA